MTIDELAGWAVHPASIAEWEDLLVRLEIMPRALASTVEEASGGAVPEILRELLLREADAARWLEAVVAGIQGGVDASEPLPAPRSPEVRWLAERFASLRARNFAMVQRRGVEVWGWAGDLADGERATVYQVLSRLLRSDAAGLAALRRAAGRVAAC